MKRRNLFAGLALAIWLLLAGGEVFAQFAVTITVDENGNGTLTNTSGFSGTLASGLQADPGPGGLPAALTYDLFSPPGMVAGDLLLLEPGSLGVLSDLIRFNPNEISPAGRTGSLVFYSDTTDGADSLADTGFPTALYTNTSTLFEVGPEAGPNGISYTPIAGQPGFVAGSAGPVTYVIRSDTAAIPEPGPLALGFIATLLGVATEWTRRKQAAA